MIPVRDGHTHFLGQSLADVARGLYAEIARHYGVKVPPLSHIADVPPIPCEVNHSRWIVRCPDCGGAEYVWFDAPQMFCMSCLNAAVGGRWRPVRLPKSRKAIEAVLLARPMIQTRSWLPHESIDTLRRENIEHGHAVEVG